MRIIDRKTFLAMPSGTVFTKFPAQPKDGSFIDLGVENPVAIKCSTIGNDFGVQDLVAWFETDVDSDAWTKTMVGMIAGDPSPPCDYHCGSRDGLYDEDQLFLVWDRDDLVRMIERLNEALVDGYTVG